MPPRKIGSSPAPKKTLPGFGPKSTMALAKIGITTQAQVRACDPYGVYARLKQNVPGTSMNFLYGLIAATEGGDWREICRTRRTEILMRLDEMGLTPR